jgi:hypothetical protein
MFPALAVIGLAGSPSGFERATQAVDCAFDREATLVQTATSVTKARRTNAVAQERFC